MKLCDGHKKLDHSEIESVTVFFMSIIMKN